jgi:hypothetical protein
MLGKAFSWYVNGEIVIEGVVKEVINYKIVACNCYDHRRQRKFEYNFQIDAMSHDLLCSTGVEWCDGKKNFPS